MILRLRHFSPIKEVDWKQKGVVNIDFSFDDNFFPLFFPLIFIDDNEIGAFNALESSFFFMDMWTRSNSHSICN